ncbi:MAG: nascent polypeptide-associated complex protein [Nitrososphaerota archaeon]|nr:nascent polypeptide-associated complex protein [Candidatus Bathyarchaeota archaeon]MCX8161413.1 nascent polypeptide-associated complex protein [Candidatus Bathyarchaeota archaeon]MDW8062100.1 nascent polypeptide-associated complex protein [Nitrososphaerota archaeon]
MRALSSREARRLMKQMGLKVNELDGVKEVVIRMEDKEIVIETPSVSVLEVSGQKIFQVLGSTKERAIEKAGVKVSEEDAQLIAAQLNIPLEEAIVALKETSGDIAEAIMLIQSRKNL